MIILLTVLYDTCGYIIDSTKCSNSPYYSAQYSLIIIMLAYWAHHHSQVSAYMYVSKYQFNGPIMKIPQFPPPIGAATKIGGYHPRSIYQEHMKGRSVHLEFIEKKSQLHRYHLLASIHRPSCTYRGSSCGCYTTLGAVQCALHST